MKKTWKLFAVLAFVTFTLAACGSKNSSDDKGSSKTITIGVAPGPYGDMAKDVLGPLLKKKGYTVKTKLFNDYIQPNKALAKGQIDANLFQHTVYLKKFAADNKLDLTAIDKVPTLGMGIYSKKIKKLSELKDGSTVALANDAANLARSLQLLEANKLVTLKDGVDPTKASVNDIEKNPKNLTFKTLDAAQLPRALDNVTVSLVPGNFAWASNLKPAKALVLEKLTEDYKNVVAVQTKNKNAAFAKALKEVLASDDFKQAIAKSDFKDFSKPASWKE